MASPMATRRAGLLLLITLGAHAQTGGYAGSQSCRACHAAFFELWSTSHHGLAMQPFTTDFAHRELSFAEPRVKTAKAVYTAALDPRGGSIVEEKSGTKHAYAIQQVLGGKYIYYFLTTLERGHMQVLPLAFDVRKRAWVETTASIVSHPGDRDQPVDWRDRMLTFNTSCYGCHVSQLATSYIANSDTYRTTWGEPGINCETCHGPSADHVRKFRERSPGDDLHILSMKRLTIRQRNEACASCHAKFTPLDVAFRPGDRFFDHYNLVALENDDYYPDGRDRRENYTYTGWLMSACAKSGKLDCLHCHTSSGRYKFAPAGQASEAANKACLPCHEERVKNAAAHSHHAAGSAGSRCVSCHMPTTEYATMRRSDHSMRPPAPAATLAYGSPNACNLCHADRDARWARDRVKEWFGEGRQQRLLAQAGLISAARKRDWSRLPAMLATILGSGGRTDRDEVFATSLIRLLEPCRDPAKVRALLNALQDASPLIRSSALNALSGNWNADTLPALSRAARDEYRVVRIQAGAVLATMDPRKLDEPSRRAAEEYIASLKSRPDDYGQHMNLGVLYADRGQSQAALDEYATAGRLRPGWAPPLVNASLVYSALGNNAKAEESLRRAIGIDPGNAAAHFNLGLLLAEMGRPADAEASLRRSLALDPKNAPAAFNLAVLVSGTRREEAIRWCRRAVEADPGEGRYVYTLAFYLAQGGETQAAIRELEAAAAHHSSTADEKKLLNSLRSR